MPQLAGWYSSWLGPRGSSLLLAMGEGWYGWRWTYVNHAVAAGVHAVVYRHAGEQPGDTSGWDGTDEVLVSAIPASAARERCRAVGGGS